MSPRDSSAAFARRDEWKGVWECRYFVPSIPAGFERERLERSLGPPDGPFADEDVYILGRDRGTNVKIRRRTRTLKVKTIVERTEDGFELWRTMSDSPLPAGREAWKDALRRLGVERDPGRLADSLDPRVIVDELCDSHPEIACLVTAKRRLFYSREGARIEVAHVTALATELATISFEAAELARAREVRTAVRGEDLGEPENYVGLAARLRSDVPREELARPLGGSPPPSPQARRGA